MPDFHKNARSLRTGAEAKLGKNKDIDQTDLHRSEPSSRNLK